MNKKEIESLAYCIRDVFCNAYFGYSMIYAMEVLETNSFRMVFLVDYGESPFTIDLEEKGITTNVQMLEFIIYKPVLNKEIEMVISNTKNRNGLPVIIPINKSIQKILFGVLKTYCISDIRDYLINDINNINK